MKQTTKYHYPIAYEGNLLLIIIIGIIWLPLGALLFIKNGRFKKNEKTYSLYYRGAFFWLIFWTLIFFPIAAILMVINGIDVMEEETMSL